LVNRIRLDGSPLVAPPLQRNDTVLLVTRDGLVRALRTP
jgi:hypothetical protein